MTLKKGKKISSKRNNSTFLIGTIGGLFFAGLGVFILLLTIERGPPVYVGLGFGAIFTSFGILSFSLTLFVDTFEIDNEKLVIKNIFGTTKREFYLKDILSYNEIKKSNKHLAWNDLTLFFIDSKLKISSSSYSNYSQFKPFLISGKKRNLASEKEWQRKNDQYFGIGFTIFGAIIAAIQIYFTYYFFEIGYIGTYWIGLFICLFILGGGIYFLRISKK